jgi:biotin-(acetyl-CoA carboxylase) ligase
MLVSQDANVHLVIPAKAGIHGRWKRSWIPAFAGMTMVVLLTEQTAMERAPALPLKPRAAAGGD